jgi:hypothetical protein
LLAGLYGLNVYAQNTLTKMGMQAKKVEWKFSKQALPYCEVAKANLQLNDNALLEIPKFRLYVVGHNKYSLQMKAAKLKVGNDALDKTLGNVEALVNCFPSMGCRIMRLKADLLSQESAVLQAKTKIKNGRQLFQGQLFLKPSSNMVQQAGVHTFFSIETKQNQRTTHLLSQQPEAVLPLLSILFSLKENERLQLAKVKTIKGPKQQMFQASSVAGPF